MTHSDQTNDNIEHKISLHKLALPQIKCYRSSLQLSLLADPATERKTALHRRRKGSLQHIGGPKRIQSSSVRFLLIPALVRIIVIM